MSEITVKTLEWDQYNIDMHKAETFFGYYVVAASGQCWLKAGPSVALFESIGKTVNAAKAACQSDYDARIRSAIERKPEPVAWQWCAYEDGSQRTSWYPEGDSYQADWEELAKKYPDKYQVVTRPLYSTPPAANEEPCSYCDGTGNRRPA